MSQIPEGFQDILAKKSFAHLATLNADGSPQVTPVWFHYDGQHIIVNTAVGRLKDRNLRRDPRVALSILDPENPYRYIQMRGRVVDFTEEGGDASIDFLAQKYLGVETFPYRQPGERRVIFRIAVEKVQATG